MSDLPADGRRPTKGAITRKHDGPVRVLYLTLNPPENILWGTELHLLDLIAGLDPERYVPLAGMVQEDGALVEALQQRNVRVLRTRLPSPARFGVAAVAAEVRASKSCLRELGQERPALVHVNSAWAGRTGVLLGQWCRAPTVLQLHGRPRPHQYLTYAAALATVVVANSHFTAEGWGWWPARRRVRVVHPGVALSIFRPSLAQRQAARRELGLSRTEFVVGCVGRGTAEKGHRYLLEALAAYRSQADSITVLLIGIPPPGYHPIAYPHVRHLHRLVADLGLHRQVRFLGLRTDVPRLLNALDLFVHPSVRESFGRAAVEAMATGLPLVATRVGGLSEVVVDGETGLLVPPADPAALGAAIGRLRADPELRKKMGESGRRRAQQHFSLHAYLRGMEEVYEMALGAGVRRRPQPQ
jgi:glycosyltransferase involved in cell wall biosynthesis